MRKNAPFWIICHGIVWFSVGIFLLLFGVKLIVSAATMDSGLSVLSNSISHYLGGREQASLFLLIFGLVIGFVKGRFVLSRTAGRMVKKIYALAQPIKFSEVYSLGYVALIGCMLLLGMAMKWFSVSPDIRGAIDVAVGSALVNAALCYFRSLVKSSSSISKV
jgi:hypothetical protein